MTRALRGLSVLGVLMTMGAMPAGATTGAGATEQPASALPAPVKAMLDAAIKSGSAGDIAAVARHARSTNPDAAEEIDAMVAAHNSRLATEREARIREAGIFGDWRGKGELGGFITTGNTESVGVSAGLSLNKEGIDWRHKLRATADYQRSGGATTRDQWLASYEPNFRLNEAIYAYGLAMYEKDRFQGFADRVTMSGGAGVRLLNQDSIRFDLKGGPAWRSTNWLLEPRSEELNTLAGSDLFLRLSRAVEFTNNAQAIWGSDNSTYTNTAALTGKLNGALSARVSYGLRHETAPPVGAEKTDTITRATLVYDF